VEVLTHQGLQHHYRWFEAIKEQTLAGVLQHPTAEQLFLTTLLNTTQALAGQLSPDLPQRQQL
jgi:hypothetical protein